MVNVNAVRICTVAYCRFLFVAAEFHQTKLSTDLHAQIYLFFFFPHFFVLFLNLSQWTRVVCVT